MVRIKHRYILFEILYPPTADTRVTPREDFNQFSQSELNALLTLHQSSPNSINVKTILNVIRKSLLDHYGDVGAGKAGMLLNVKYFLIVHQQGYYDVDEIRVIILLGPCH